MAKPIISLEEITKETLRGILDLRVAPDQERFVASNAVSLAEAYFSRDIAWFRAILADGTPVGFLMLDDDGVQEDPYLWRFMIDSRYQKRGFGKQALEVLIEHVRKRPGVRALTLSCVPGHGSPGAFYEKLGFVYTGEEEHGELVMRLDLES